MFQLDTFPLEQKTVFLRVDYNVPLGKRAKEISVADATKIEATLPTIRFLLKKKCKVIIATHLGRPQGKEKEFQVDPLVKSLQKLLPRRKIIKLDDCIGAEVRGKIARARLGEIIFLENLRFYPDEEENNLLFAHSLAALAEVYINDAFAVAHRRQASVEAITKFLPAIPGKLLEKEVGELGKALSPKRPAVWIFGGAKLEKVHLLEKALEKADTILIGGALAFSFLKAQGYAIGASRVDAQSITIARRLLQKRTARKIVLPHDVIIAERFSAGARHRVVPITHISSDTMGLDIGPQTIQLFQAHLQGARTIVWNGPLGYVEWAAFAPGTKKIARFLAQLPATVTTICGGGTTAQALHQFGVADRFTHVSTGGGAALAFLAGEKLPGLMALEKNYREWRKKI